MARSLRAWAIGAFLVGIWAPGLPAQGAAPRVVPVEPELQDGIYSWYSATFPGTYRKEPDGTFQLVEQTFDVVTSAASWTTVRSVRPVAAPDPRGNAVPQSSTLLDAFMPGGIARAPSALPVYAGRNLLLIFSRESLASFAALEAMQRQVGEWAAVQKEVDIRAAGEAFGRMPLKQQFTAALATILRGTFATVTIADNLSALGPSNENALIVDFGFSENTLKFLGGMRLQRNGRGGAQPPSLYTRRMSWILLDRERDVVRSSFKVDAHDDAFGSGADLLTDISQRIQTSLGTDILFDLGSDLKNWPAPSTPLSIPAPAKAATGFGLELLKGEVVAKTRQGCGIVLDMTDSTPSGREVFIQYIRSLSWYYVPGKGSCDGGLAQGTGWLISEADMQKNRDQQKAYEARKNAAAAADVFDILPDAIFTSDYFRGRDMDKSSTNASGPSPGFFSYSVHSQSVIIPMLPDPFAPVWEGSTTSLTSPGGARVETVKETCDSSEKACSDKSYDIYGVKLTNKTNRAGLTTWCPNKRSPVGCEALWQEKAGPIIASMKALVKEYDAERSRRILEIGALAKEAIANRVTADKAQSEIETVRFSLRLDAATANGPGALFALADAMAAEKKPSESRQALIALVARYSSQPLGLIAAKRLAALTK